MKKVLCLAVVLLFLAAGAVSLQRMPPGTQAIFLKDGESLAGKIVDVTLPQMDFKLEEGKTIPLRDLWMINFETAEWDFPEERNVLESNDCYVFLKSGDIYSGRLSAYSAETKSFVFASGEYFPLVQCRRMYFSKTVPRNIR
ncbi:MAG: hypothetical protein JW843_01365 [Candidatus Aminicenantes bacterium]|nr:hypothetical protein [Candidatus Aminicenantes bacterium]